MLTLAHLQAQRAQILALAAQYGARQVRVFGSIVNGTADPESDVDLLVDMETGRSLLHRIGLQQALEDLLHCRVDVVTEAALHATIRTTVLQQAVAL